MDSLLRIGESALTGDNAHWSKYRCSYCEYLLHDAVQTSCGHWMCESCARKAFANGNPTCPREDCDEQLMTEDGKPFFPDRFVRKEIAKLPIKCTNHEVGCEWNGVVSQLSKHLGMCPFAKFTCPDCHESVLQAEEKAHRDVCPKILLPCPFGSLGCDDSEKMRRDCLLDHLTEQKGLMRHFMLIAASLVSLKDDGLHHSTNEDRIEKDGGNRSHRMQARPSATRAAHPSIRQVEADGGGATGSLHSPRTELFGFAHGGAVERQVLALSSSVESIRFDLDTLQSQLRQKDDIIATLQSRIQELERTQQTKSSENEDRDFRLSLIENSNFDGTMIWKVPQFSQRMEDARSGKYTSIFSLPFYSGRYGYKMCLRLYILGDGIGRGTHMSLFFVVMKGEFDNILPWPFTYKVTFKLLNQSGGRDITDVFQPDPMSSSFQKPKTDMNVASGCPRFISLQELMSGGFIVDDTVFVKVRVDTANMKHP